ncbi:MAG: hypothetical protein P4L53_04680 [Candidatus Obscuribacterales bacterium]|nr:hypothetical protein [Candidatus Obscuribacterales bacterium]
MINSHQVTTPKRLLSMYSPILKARAIAMSVPAAGTDDATDALKAKFVELCLKTIANANLSDAISLSEHGFLQPVTLSKATQKEFDRLVSDFAGKAQFLADVSAVLHRHQWRVELRVNGSYMKGLKRSPRHVLFIFQLSESDMAKIAELEKRAQFPNYGHAARLLDDLNLAREFFDGDGNAFVEERLQQLGPLAGIALDDNERLIGWAEGIREIEREYIRRDFQPLRS